MSAQVDFQTLGEQIQNAYDDRVVVTVRDDHINLMIYGIDLSSADASVPEDGGPFKTLDDPESHIPESIRTVVDSAGYDLTVLGHGGDNLHVHVR